MVSQSVERVLKAEGENTEMLERANQAASKIVDDANKKAADMMSEALKDAQQKADELKLEAEKVIKDIYAAGKADAETKVSALERQINSKKEEAISLAVKILTQ